MSSFYGTSDNYIFLSVTFLTERHYNYQYHMCGIEKDHVLFALKVVLCKQSEFLVIVAVIFLTLQMHSVLVVVFHQCTG